MAAFLDPKTVIFLDKRELSYCVDQLKDVYATTNQQNNQESSDDENDTETETILKRYCYLALL